MAFPKQWDSNGYEWIIPKAKSCTREHEEAVLDAKMPDPHSITTKPEHRLLRARAFKRDPTCSFTLEVTGKHQLSTSNHEQVKWVPAAPDNASWADTVEYKWESKVSQDGSAKLFPVLVKHSYVAKYADEDAIVSSSQDIYKAYLCAVRLLQAAGHKVTRPTTPTAPVKPPVKTTTTSYDISDDEDSSDDEEADMIVIVRPRRAPKPKVPTGWAPPPCPATPSLPRSTMAASCTAGTTCPCPSCTQSQALHVGTCLSWLLCGRRPVTAPTPRWPSCCGTTLLLPAGSWAWLLIVWLL